MFQIDYKSTKYTRFFFLVFHHLTCLLKQGRKIAKEKCVSKPTMVEIFDCAQLLGFQSALELDKAYCRDYWQRGRIRIRLFDENKRLFREDIPDRKLKWPTGVANHI